MNLVRLNLYRPTKILLAFVLSMALVAGLLPERAGSLSFGISQASAQQKKKRSLFSILFGNRAVKRKTVRRKLKRKKVRRSVKKRAKVRKKSASVKRAKPSTTARRTKRKTPQSAKTAVPGAVIAGSEGPVEKQENARRVVVMGDFLASGLSDGLSVAFQNNALIDVVDASKGSSGFVRSDIINWPENIGPVTTKQTPSFIVAMLGTNDRQLMRVDGKRLKKRTPEWDAAYKERVTSFGAALKQTGIPFVWVGLPPVRYTSMNTDLLLFNEWYREAALAAGGKFVDVWDGFSDAEGAYSRSGPDVNGQIVLLRNKDGINLTRAGRRRLAFYVEGIISKQLGGALALSSLEDLSGVSVLTPSEPEYDPAQSGQTVVIRLNDPASEGASELAGEVIDLSQHVGVKPAIPVAASGRIGNGNSRRADNFSWPPETGGPALPAAVAQSN